VSGFSRTVIGYSSGERSLHMKRTAVVFAIALAAEGLVAGQAPPMPKPGPEHQRLGVFVGNWTFAGEMKPGPMGPGGKMTGTDRIQWMPGNFVVERRFEGKGPMGQVSGLEIMTYDSAKKPYTYNFFDSTGSLGTGTMTVSGDTWTFAGAASMGGKPMQERCSLVFSAGSTSLKIMCEMSGDGKSWAPVVEGTATKSK
jgi:Protein of unknown function (DUF1579)